MTCHLARRAIIGSCFVVAAISAQAKQESFWIEKLSVMLVGNIVCQAKIDPKTMDIATGSAMIELGINRDEVFTRLKTRADHIVTELQKQHTVSTFCQALTYYVKKGYPR